MTLRAATLLIAALLAGCDEDAGEQGRDPAEVAALAAAYTAAWNSGDPASVAAYYAPLGKLTINGGDPAEGRAAVEAVAAGFMEAFPDLTLSNDRIEDTGERIEYHWTLTGTNSGPGGTGNRVTFSGYEAWTLDADGLVLDSVGSFDSEDYARQLYAQPPVLAALGLEVFPPDHSLARAEDGVALADGDLLLVDQPHGLRRLHPDGSSEPFGTMLAAGYPHAPPQAPGGANGISLEPDGEHVLVADIFHGGIYRVSLADGAAEKVYQHAYGVNTAVRDRSGAIWFTQSAHNPPDNGEAAMWAAIDRPLAQGALLRLPPGGDTAETLLDGLLFANGLALDEAAGALYLAETTAEAVTRYSADFAAGTVSDPEIVVSGVVPDNIELDDSGQLWVAAPLPNNVLIHDTRSGDSRFLLPPPSDARQALHDEWRRMGAAGESRMAFLTPEAWAPMPGFLTGVVLGAADGRVYITGLSNALLAVQVE